MQSIFLQKGRTFHVADPDALNIQEQLPVGTYIVGVTPAGFHLEQVDDFELPAKLYGNVDTQAARILNTFFDRPGSTGCLFAGHKGSGKTMLIKRISQRAALEHGVITLMINQPIYGEEFNAFLQGIEQPKVVLFDEFEKTYDSDQQQRLLTIFDGTYTSKTLFLLTCNDSYRVDNYMHNRPGRIFYSLKFGGLGRDFIMDYCADNLKDASKANGVVNVSTFFSDFTFDMLKALVEEMNRYGESATDAMQMLNIKPQNDAGGRYNIEIMRNGRPVVRVSDSSTTLTCSPLMADGWQIYLEGSENCEENDPRIKPGCIVEDEHFNLDVNKLISVDPMTGTFVFATHRPDTTLHVTREVPKVYTFDYDAF